MIFLSNRCNLSCDYCFVAVNEGETALLDFDSLRKAADYFVDSSEAGRRRVSFLGGEPFLQLPVVLKTIDYIRGRAAGDDVAVNVYTNGTLMDAGNIRALEDCGAWIILSLDGDKQTNDKHRVFLRSEMSVFDEVMGRLANVSKQRMGVNMVFSPDTVESLASNVRFFDNAGFRSINFYPDVYFPWAGKSLAPFEGALRKIADEYIALFLSGRKDPFNIPTLPYVVRRAGDSEGETWWRECGNLVLGADGHYHACDKAMSFQPGQALQSRVGRPAQGLDTQRRDALFQEAVKFVNATAPPGQRYSFCPMGAFFYSQWSGNDAAIALGNFLEVNRIYQSAFLRIVRELGDNPLFQTMYHLPMPITS